MRDYLFIPSFVLLAVLFYLPASSSGTPVEQAAMPESKSQLIKLTDVGIEPAQISMNKGDSVAFFLNDSKEALVTVEIDFRNHSTHCASANMRAGDDGIVRSTKPLGPSDFATTCFHEAGNYNFTVFGLPKNPDGVKGTISVQ